jgi:hypothetical protein
MSKNICSCGQYKNWNGVEYLCPDCKPMWLDDWDVMVYLDCRIDKFEIIRIVDNPNKGYIIDSSNNNVLAVFGPDECYPTCLKAIIDLKIIETVTIELDENRLIFDPVLDYDNGSCDCLLRSY